LARSQLHRLMETNFYYLAWQFFCAASNLVMLNIPSQCSDDDVMYAQVGTSENFRVRKSAKTRFILLLISFTRHVEESCIAGFNIPKIFIPTWQSFEKFDWSANLTLEKLIRNRRKVCMNISSLE